MADANFYDKSMVPGAGRTDARQSSGGKPNSVHHLIDKYYGGKKGRWVNFFVVLGMCGFLTYDAVTGYFASPEFSGFELTLILIAIGVLLLLPVASLIHEYAKRF